MAGPYMTIKEIEAAYPNEWVLVDRVKEDRYQRTVGGVVISHGTDKEAVLRAADPLPKPFNLAFFYTGSIPEDVIFIL